MKTQKINPKQAAKIITTKAYNSQPSFLPKSNLNKQATYKSLITTYKSKIQPVQAKSFLLINSCKLYAKGLEQVIRNEFSNVLIDTLCADPAQVQFLAFSKAYNLVIVDLDLKTDELIQSLEFISSKLGNVPILLLAKRKNTLLIEACKELNIQGYLLKDSDSNLIPAINNLLAKGEYYSHDLKKLKNKEIDDLSYRELQILNHIFLGYTNTAIAHKLFISTETVKTHKRNIKEKLGVADAHGLIKHYINHYS